LGSERLIVIINTGYLQCSAGRNSIMPAINCG
jgi:hypothetical protein